jgi:hypothetical protein
MTTAREKSIKLLVAKFVKLVESLDPGERLSIRKVGAKKSAAAGVKRKKKAAISAAKRVKPSAAK